MMPGENGLDLARELKATRSIPICMLTARSEPEHRIEGLETGVDDYIPKPFEPRELLLRLRNILRRGAGPTGPHEEIRMGATRVPRRSRGELTPRRRDGEAHRARARPLAHVRPAHRHADPAT